MNFVVDESVDGQIVERLRDDGHSVFFKKDSPWRLSISVNI